MNILKRFFAKRKLNKILTEEEQIEELNNQVEETKKINSEVLKDKISNKRKAIKLLELANQEKQLQESLGIFAEEEEEEEEEEDEMKESFKNLILNSINKPKQATQTNGFPESDSDFSNSGNPAKTSNSPIEGLFDKVRLLPVEKQKQLMDLAVNYL